MRTPKTFALVAALTAVLGLLGACGERHEIEIKDKPHKFEIETK